MLLGPTGAGKTPLGDWLEAHGLRSHACHHFDFGAALRRTVARGPSGTFPADEIRFLKRVLEEGVLLEDESFHLAAKILTDFIARRRIRQGQWLLLNGLPRHTGQAKALEAFVHVRAVIELKCSAPVVQARIQSDSGGDRATRRDDGANLVARKLAIYRRRTRPLVAYFRRRGASVISFDVSVHSRPAEIAQGLETISSLR